MHIHLFRKQIITLIIVCIGVLGQYSIYAAVQTEKGKTAKKDTTKKVDFVPVPYLNYNRTGGFEFGAVPMAMYKLNSKDTISPASMSGLIGMYSTEKNWVAMGFQRLYFKEDTWRMILAGGFAYKGFQFFINDIGGEPINYNTSAGFFYGEIQRKIYKKLYGGLIYIYGATETRYADSDMPVNTTFQSIGAKFSWDSRSSIYYPMKGVNTNLKWSSAPEFLGNEYVSNRLEIDHNHYLGIKNERDVFAFRLKGGFGIGDLAFEQQFVVGKEDLRGYTQGKYRGESIATLQGEYRWNIKPKFGLVAFGGVATIWQSVNEEYNGILLPSLGTGFRVNVFPKHHMNVGMDAAVGKDDWGIYFRIGEAF